MYIVIHNSSTVQFNTIQYTVCNVQFNFTILLHYTPLFYIKLFVFIGINFNSNKWRSFSFLDNSNKIPPMFIIFYFQIAFIVFSKALSIYHYPSSSKILLLPLLSGLLFTNIKTHHINIIGLIYDRRRSHNILVSFLQFLVLGLILECARMRYNSLVERLITA